MTTLYNLIRQACGLSQPEAANFHGVRLDTIKNWCQGKSEAPLGVIDELRDLWSDQSEHIRKTIEVFNEIEATKGKPASFSLEAVKTDQEAENLGYPCVGAQHAVLGHIIAMTSGKPILK